MRHWSWILTAVAVVGLAVVIYPLVQTQKRLKLTQAELGKANEQVVQARAGAAELERVIANLKTELDVANKSRNQLQGNLDKANSEIEKVKEEFSAAQSQLKETRSQNSELSAQLEDAKRAADEASAKVEESAKQISDLASKAESASAQLEQLSENQSQLDTLTAQLEEAHQTAAEANTKVTELEKEAADAQAESTKLQAALDRANAEVERLKTELQNKDTVPSQDRDSALRPLASSRAYIARSHPFDRPAAKVAYDLIGCHLHWREGEQSNSRIITETEAFAGPDD
jgi:chromosome segregation ATPase